MTTAPMSTETLHKDGLGAPMTIDDLTVHYDAPAGRVNALTDITLNVAAGSSTAIVGPSGCGKSTLLGIIGGLELPSSGTVRIGDRAISSLAEKQRAEIRRRMFGFVFQADNLQPFLNVSENVSLQCALAGVEENGDHLRLLLEAMEIGHLGHRFPDQLSGGQRQRAAVARALVHGPQVVLADEPTGALDAKSSSQVVELLLRLHKQHGTTLVVVTHDRAVADHMEMVVEMRDGRIAGRDGRS